MQERKVKEGEKVITQGGKGDYFYVCESGSFDVFVDDEQVHTYVTDLEKEQFPCFGELALLYSKPRAATVVGQTEGSLWRLARSGFRMVSLSNSHATGSHALMALRKIDFFSSLMVSQ